MAMTYRLQAEIEATGILKGVAGATPGAPNEIVAAVAGTDFATAAQGAKADSAAQVADIPVAYSSPGAYDYFRDKFSVAAADTLILFSDGSHSTTGDATLHLASVSQHGGPVAIFGGTNLTNLDIHLAFDSGPTGYGDSLAAIICPEVLTVGYNAAAFCYRLVKVDLPKCTGLNPDDTGGTANNGAVFLYAAFDEIELPAVQVLCGYAFAGNTRLRRVSIPATTKIGGHVFDSCSSLEVVDFGNALQSVPALAAAHAFENTPDSLVIVVPDALYDTWTATSNWATVAQTKRIVRHSDWAATHGTGLIDALAAKQGDIGLSVVDGAVCMTFEEV